ncbi:MAG: 50S ribosomal protein L18 [Omnitrophica bacterium GWA2_52_8]|nr:MAG: 50S ribosomal protein L18 [Omnitrophica bacterium GWA2_52_8]
MRTKEQKRVKRHLGIRKRVVGTSERPRLAVHRSLKNIYVQAIDDMAAATMASFSTRDEKFLKAGIKGKKSEVSSQLGTLFAEELKKKGIKKIAFDRAGYKYHGRIKALAESLRASGIEF